MSCQTMIKLRRAIAIEDWQETSELLQSAVRYLHSIHSPLWSEHQVSVEGLKAIYQLDELCFFVGDQDETLGVVFLQTADPYFWPEIAVGDSLFVHKLAIDPVHKGKGYGSAALQLIMREAKARHLRCVRLDCDDREPLHRFYTGNGFKLVDIKMLQEFRVARYELHVN